MGDEMVLAAAAAKPSPNSTNLAIVANVMQASHESKDIRANLIINPASMFIRAGLQIDDEHQLAFNAFFKKEAEPAFQAMDRDGDAFELNAVPGIGCMACQVGCFSIAAVIVAVGIAGLSTLTVASTVVLAVASWAGVAPLVALAFVIALGTIIVQGVAKVAEAMCEWVGAC